MSENWKSGPDFSGDVKTLLLALVAVFLMNYFRTYSAPEFRPILLRAQSQPALNDLLAPPRSARVLADSIHRKSSYSIVQLSSVHEFEARDQSGRIVDLSEYAGKVQALNDMLVLFAYPVIKDPSCCKYSARRERSTPGGAECTIPKVSRARICCARLPDARVYL